MERNQSNENHIPTIRLEDLKNILSPVPDDMIDELNDDWEYDRTDSDLKLDRKRYKIEIDWSQYNETQIQTLISLLFQYSGYDVENWHLADRSHEEGADLKITDGKGNIALQVKIKPKTGDRSQLIDLAKREERRKVYVYIETPSKKFLDFANEYKHKIEFWNKKTLNQYFLNINIGFTSSLVFDSHPLSKNVQKARQILFDIYDKCKNKKLVEYPPLEEMSREIIWRLKDNAVSFHKTNLSIIPIFEKPVYLRNHRLNEHFVKIFLKYLDILDIELSSYIHYFTLFYTNNTDLVHNSVISNIATSHWVWLTQYKTNSDIDNLNKEFIDIKNISTKISQEDFWKQKAKTNDVWEEMKLRIRQLAIFGRGIEAVIDDIAREYGFIFRPTL